MNGANQARVMPFHTLKKLIRNPQNYLRGTPIVGILVPAGTKCL
jgi:hypothetical protein